MRVYLVWRAYGIFMLGPFKLVAVFDSAELVATYVKHYRGGGTLRVTTSQLNEEIPDEERPQ